MKSCTSKQKAKGVVVFAVLLLLLDAFLPCFLSPPSFSSSPHSPSPSSSPSAFLILLFLLLFLPSFAIQFRHGSAECLSASWVCGRKTRRSKSSAQMRHRCLFGYVMEDYQRWFVFPRRRVHGVKLNSLGVKSNNRALRRVPLTFFIGVATMRR